MIVTVTRPRPWATCALFPHVSLLSFVLWCPLQNTVFSILLLPLIKIATLGDEITGSELI